jgi:parallel beta-helix repeat protein
MKYIVLAITIISSLILLTPDIALAATITVPDDYPSIQAAVDSASDGDTIIVKDGSYSENLDVSKQLTIRSENGVESTTVTAADINDHVFYVTSENVVIDGFTITGATGEDLSEADVELRGRAGIFIGDGGGKSTISSNVLHDNYYGIKLVSSSENTIESNTVYSSLYEGIYLYTSSNSNSIRKNTAYSNGGHGGIFLWMSCKDNTITENTCYSNPDHGIKIHEDSDNTLIENNLCYDNGGTNIFIGFSDNNIIRNNRAVSGPSLGIILRVANNNLVENNNASYNGETGIAVDFGNFDNTFRDNICSYNNIGMSLRLSSNNNLVTSNNCNHNKFVGLHILSSRDNTITSNDLSSNLGGGITIEGSGLISQDETHYEWEVFRNMDGPWTKFKERMQELGIEMVGHNSENNEISQNSLEDNVGISISNEAPSDVDASDNWWGDPSGPFHPQKNPEGKGEEFHERSSGAVNFENWLDSDPFAEAPSPPSTPAPPIVIDDGEQSPGDNTFLIIIAVIIILVVIVLVYLKSRK